MAHPDRGELGRSAEDLAVAHLEAGGAQILLRNFRRRTGELDIIAQQGSTWLVVEVRLRSRAAEEAAREAADWGERALPFPAPQRPYANRTNRRPA
jgi:Holliday junction resolvase-like predicted endonuclease